ncbi:MAG TPA: SMP-30/gluconolactonase/LRE family protein [Thermoanaerobaculia bacterium]|nr:SMP-30/gluconolactonase/LRE family protein [Thermoanaerobaculia bacterium]
MTFARLRLTGLTAALFVCTVSYAHSSMDLRARVTLLAYLAAGAPQRVDVFGDVLAFDPASGVTMTIETDTGSFTGSGAPTGWRCEPSAKRILCAADEAGPGPLAFHVNLTPPASGSVAVTATFGSVFGGDPKPNDNVVTATSRVYTPSSCGTQAPALLSATPARSGVDLKWVGVPGATSYDVLVSIDGETPHRITSSSTTEATARLAGGGDVTWFVRANFDGCPSVDSAGASFEHAADGPRLSVTSIRSALLNQPVSVDIDGTTLVIGDAGARALRRYDPATGAVTDLILGGDVNSPRLTLDGEVAVGPGGYYYIADGANHLIRYVYPDSRFIFPAAGTSGTAGTADGLGRAARVSSPAGLAIDAFSRVYIADSGNDTIRRMAFDAPKGEFAVTTFVPASAGLDDPAGLAFDAEGNLYVADRGNHVIRRISPQGSVTTIAGVIDTPGHRDGDGAQALFDKPFGIAVDAYGNVLVTEEGNHTVRRIAPNGAVTTVAGSPGQPGDADGLGESARFNRPGFLTIAADGVVWIADRGNASLRRAVFAVPGPKRRTVRN